MWDETKRAVSRVASEEAGRLAEQAEATIERTRDLVREAADAVGERARDGAERLQSSAAAAGERIRHDLGTVRGEVEALVRRHPIEALLVGAAIGYLLARGTRA